MLSFLWIFLMIELMLLLYENSMRLKYCNFNYFNQKLYTNHLVFCTVYVWVAKPSLYECSKNTKWCSTQDPARCVHEHRMCNWCRKLGLCNDTFFWQSREFAIQRMHSLNTHSNKAQMPKYLYLISCVLCDGQIICSSKIGKRAKHLLSLFFLVNNWISTINRFNNSINFISLVAPDQPKTYT